VGRGQGLISLKEFGRLFARRGVVKNACPGLSRLKTGETSFPIYIPIYCGNWLLRKESKCYA